MSVGVLCVQPATKHPEAKGVLLTRSRLQEPACWLRVQTGKLWQHLWGKRLCWRVAGGVPSRTDSLKRGQAPQGATHAG